MAKHIFQLLPVVGSVTRVLSAAVDPLLGKWKLNPRADFPTR